MKTIAVLFAEGFEEMEAVTIVDVLRRADFRVLMTGVDALTVQGSHEILIHMDIMLNELSSNEVDAVVLPGGMPGAKNLAEHPQVLDLLRNMQKQNKPLAAICAAPTALHAAGVMNGINFTCYPSFASGISEAHYTGASVTSDGNIITGNGPGSALEFSLLLVEKFGRPETARELRARMLVDSLEST